MLIWVCAMHCEAKPVIDFYRLKKSHGNNAFDLYRGDNMACIISGIGKLASAAASAWIAATHDETTSIAWVNLGIAGAATHEPGAIFALNQVIDADTGQRYYPIPGADSTLPGCACLTLSQPSDDYREEYLFDMEASGFMHSALRFSSAELTQSIKIVSDNHGHQTGKDRPRVSALIHQHIELIDKQATGLIAKACNNAQPRLHRSSRSS
jgi:nucleoside phosphorylase